MTVPAHLAGTRWTLTRDSHIVGRFGDIRLPAPDVSKRHAELRRGSDGVWLNDLASSNGVLHNGVRIEPGRPVRLSEGDQLRFGSMWLTFRNPADQPDTRLIPEADGPSPHPHVNPGPSTVTDVRDFRNRSRNRGDGARPAATPPTPPPHPPHHAQPPPIEDDARTMATRHLAAATQLDPGFADLVVHQVVNEPYRALAPVFGADLGIVTRWALSARRRRLSRDGALCALLVFLVAVIGIGVRTHLDELRAGQADFDWQGYAVAAVAVLTLAWLVLALDVWVTQFLVLRRKLTASRYDPAHTPEALGSRVRERLAAVAERPAGNMVVCSDYWPFAGSGDQVDEWERPVDIRKGARSENGGGRRRPQPFTTGELYDVLIAAARGLGLANLRVEERLFVDGHDVARDQRLLPDRLRPPLTRIPTALIRSMPDGLGTTRRSYVSIEVPAWSGQLVLTMFLRAVQVQGTLYLEFSAYALLPMRPEYYTVDNLPHRTAGGAAVRALTAALPWTLPALLRSPGALVRRAAASRAAAAHRRRQRRTISGGYRFDYGAQYSIREYARGLDEGRYFLGRDLTRILNTTQQHLLNTIGDFLESKDIDSDDFQRLQQNIVQNFGDDNRVYADNNRGNLIAHAKNARAGGAPGGRRGGGGQAPGRSAQQS
ncbi:FHA domain-containing protein [Streptomyces sp. NPDC060223]|uniref:FHA domain-containing protein n=1 Tax=unclassified Streptomyces TaxID=2593676 RepID=UPI00362C0A30